MDAPTHHSFATTWQISEAHIPELAQSAKPLALNPESHLPNPL
jgi:hypothetical protein